jgi:hypothetical protein
MSKVNEGARLVQEWQDYLFALENGKSAAAMSTMKNIAQREQNVFDIPRSEILTRVQSLENAEKNEIKSVSEPIFKSIRTLDDLAPALAQLRANSSLYHSPELNMQLSALEAISKAYTAFKNGFSTSLPGYSGPTETDPLVNKLRGQFLLLVLPRILGTEGKNMPNNDETVEHYLQRMSDAALAAKDYDLLGRVIMVRRDVSLSLAGSVDARSMQEFTALGSFREGQNEERAQRFMEAVLAYMRTLRSGTPVVPAEVVGERLTAIERDHPEEYRRATEMMRRGDGGEFRGHAEPPRELKVPPSAAPPPAVPRNPVPLSTPSVTPTRPS